MAAQTSSHNFQIWLPSTTSADIFPDNSPSDFKTELDKELILTAGYECALLELFYNHDWKNIREKRNHFYVRNSNKVYKLRIPAGYYATGKEVCDAVNLELKHNFFNIRMIYNKPSNKIHIEVGYKDCLAILVDRKSLLGPILGLQANYEYGSFGVENVQSYISYYKKNSNARVEIKEQKQRKKSLYFQHASKRRKLSKPPSNKKTIDIPESLIDFARDKKPAFDFEDFQNKMKKEDLSHISADDLREINTMMSYYFSLYEDGIKDQTMSAVDSNDVFLTLLDVLNHIVKGLHEELVPNLPPHITQEMIKHANQRNMRDEIETIYIEDGTVDVNTTKLIYVYTNITEHRFVGRKQYQLLRVVKVNGRHLETGYAEIKEPQWIDVNTNNLDQIHIYLRDSYGQSIDFNPNCETIAVLGFRKK